MTTVIDKRLPYPPVKPRKRDKDRPGRCPLCGQATKPLPTNGDPIDDYVLKRAREMLAEVGLVEFYAILSKDQ